MSVWVGELPFWVARALNEAASWVWLLARVAFGWGWFWASHHCRYARGDALSVVWMWVSFRY